MDLVSVGDYDPFDGDGVTLQPVNHNPFAVQHAMDTMNAQEQARRNTVTNLLRSTAGAPGTVAQPVQSTQPGMWSDEDEAQRQATETAAANWAPREALSMIGTGAPAAVESALGSAAGKGIRAAHFKTLPVNHDPFADKSM